MSDVYLGIAAKETVETPEKRKPVAIAWYRTPLQKDVMKAIHVRSDVKGAIQTVGYLGVLLLTGIVSFYSWGHWPWFVTALLVFLHGTGYAFLINGVHELGHGTVFKTKSLNNFFVRILAFMGWINFEMFNASHTKHHRYTLHPPDDLEVVLPIKLMIRHFILHGFIDPVLAYKTFKETVRIARGKFQGEWEMTLFPENDKEGRSYPVNWARTILVGHSLIAAVSLYFGYWIIPIIVTLAPFYGGWIFFLCNNTQHIGLQDNVPDFRLCCRTFLLNPVTRFMYWQMNYHTEHHMYAAVPCYHLGKLHQAIKHDLPPCPNGIIATWKIILDIQRKQEADPNYQYEAPLPKAQPQTA